jgi:hypothetical protein
LKIDVLKRHCSCCNPAWDYSIDNNDLTACVDFQIGDTYEAIVLRVEQCNGLWNLVLDNESSHLEVDQLQFCQLGLGPMSACCKDDALSTLETAAERLCCLMNHWTISAFDYTSFAEYADAVRVTQGSDDASQRSLNKAKRIIEEYKYFERR